jgi:hypothetical protein
MHRRKWMNPLSMYTEPSDRLWGGPPGPQPAPWPARWQPIKTIAYPAVSLAVLTPCFWQRRIQAGDLSSHIYNAWLTQLIEQGRANGLTLVRQSHNVLFDLLLSLLLKLFGAGPAQRIAVGAAVLVFFWGAFAMVWTASRRDAPWVWTPCLAMLAYGWVFHMGLFNFYVSLGLAFWALALAQAWRGRSVAWRWPAVGVLLAVSYVAHPLPVVWAVGVLVYGRVARAMAPRYRILLAGASLAGLALLGVLLKLFFRCQWASGQAMGFSGADQIWVFGDRYLPLALAVLALWAFSFQRVLERRGLRRTLMDVRLHVAILSAACVVLLPTIVVLPGSGQAESLLIARMSLAGAVLYCALAAAVPARKWVLAGMGAVAAIFFCFVYQDESALNRVEDRMERVVAQLPPGQRVVSALMDTNLREFSLLHVVDRVCLGRCFSYANYEPSVGQFRVRAERQNGIVTPDFRDSWAMQAGGYVVKPSDLPLYRIDLCGAGKSDLCAAPVAAGVTLQRTWLHVTPELWAP